MQSLNRPSQPVKQGPAPTLWAWRLQRLMLTPLFRLGLRMGLPFLLTFGVVYLYLDNAERQTAIADKIIEVRENIQDRPEFMVNLMAVEGGDLVLEDIIRRKLAIDFPISSFALDLEAARKKLLTLPQVARAELRVRPGGVLHVEVTPRIPVALWRNHEGLFLVDVQGTRVSEVSLREDHPELPLLVGEGAQKHIEEAMELVHAAQPLAQRLLGVVRMGMRRWDIVLDRNQRILLPTEGAMEALARVIALEETEKVFGHDIVRVDMRLMERPTVMMTEEATQEMWRIRGLAESGQ